MDKNLIPNDPSGGASVSRSDLMLLLRYGMEKPDVEDMLNKAKKNYVLMHHTNTITHMVNASGYKKNKWKTYIGTGKKRKEMTRKTKEELIDALYDYYTSQDSLTRVFEALMIHKQCHLNRTTRTIQEDRRMFSHMGKLAEMRIACITDEDIQQWLVDDYLKTNPTEASLRKHLQLLGQLFSYGIKKKYCIDNPMIYVSVHDYLQSCDLTFKPNEQKAFSDQQLNLITADISKHMDNPRALMALMAKNTGMRRGELCALHADDIKDGYIHVHRQLRKDKDADNHDVYYELAFTKDEQRHPHNGRMIPILPECQKAIMHALNLPGESEYLFHDQKGRPVNTDSYTQYLRRRCRAILADESNDLTEMPTNNHAFRIAFNAKLIDMGLSAADRATILGHEVETNERHYSLTDERRLENIREVLLRKRA